MGKVLKIVLMGDKGVCKTALLECYGADLTSDIKEIIGVDWYLRQQEIANQIITFQFWEIAAHNRFAGVLSFYYLGSRGGLILYDVTRPETFHNISNWIQEYWRDNCEGIIPLAVLGNKVDLRDQFPNAVTPEEAQEYCMKLSEQTFSRDFEVKYLETSAKTGLNVLKAFEHIGEVSLKTF